MNKEQYPYFPPKPPHKDGVFPKTPYWPQFPNWPTGWTGWNDTEPASVGPWGCCPPIPHDDCVCVTQEDVDKWNSYSALSALSGIDWDALQSISGLDIGTSAEYWNSCYETVETHSGVWDKLPELSAFVDAFSGKVADDIFELTSATSGYLDKVYVEKKFDPITRRDGDEYVLEGEGTPEIPLQYGSDVLQLLHYVEYGKPIKTGKNTYGKPYSDKLPFKLPFMTKEDFYSYSASINDLNEKCIENEREIKALKDLIHELIDLYDIKTQN